MDISSDSKKGSISGKQPGEGRPIQPVTSSCSKAAEAAQEQQRSRNMATIADDDDRLLVRIGYTPVCWSGTITRDVH